MHSTLRLKSTCAKTFEERWCFPVQELKARFYLAKHHSIYSSISKFVGLFFFFHKLCSINALFFTLIGCYYYYIGLFSQQTSYHVYVPSYLYHDSVCAEALAILKQRAWMAITSNTSNQCRFTKVIKIFIYNYLLLCIAKY